MIRSLFVLLALSAALAQHRPPIMEDAGRANLPQQSIGANDLIAVSVYDAPELTRSVRVDADGAIHLPLLKNQIEADGLLPRQLEAAIAAALKDEQIPVDPIVSVTIVEYYSRPISAPSPCASRSPSRRPATSRCSKRLPAPKACPPKRASKSWSACPRRWSGAFRSRP